MQSQSYLLERTHRYLVAPDRRKFYIYLGLLWILNLADVWQTMALKYSGNLAQEANTLVDHVLSKGPFYFVAFKVLAVLLVTLILWRGYFSNVGIKVCDSTFTPEQVRTAILFLQVVAIFYYLLVVYIPMIFVFMTYDPSLEAANV